MISPSVLFGMATESYCELPLMCAFSSVSPCRGGFLVTCFALSIRFHPPGCLHPGLSLAVQRDSGFVRSLLRRLFQPCPVGRLGILLVT